MPRAEFYDLDVRAAVETGDARNIEVYESKTLQFIGPFTANIDIEVSLDGTTFDQFGATVSAPGIVELPGTYKSIRLNTTSYTSGTPVVKFGGRHSSTR